MSTGPSTITGVDFVTVLVEDFPAAMRFYGTVLGLPRCAGYGRIDSGVCHMAIFADPDGNILMFHNPLRAEVLRARTARGGAPYLTVSLPSMPPSRWPATEQ